MVDVCLRCAGDKALELGHEPAEEVASRSPASVVGLVLEQLLVRLAQGQVWQDDLLDDLNQDRLVVKVLGVLGRDNSSEELKSFADQDIVLCLEADRHEERP